MTAAEQRAKVEDALFTAWLHGASFGRHSTRNIPMGNPAEDAHFRWLMYLLVDKVYDALGIPEPPRPRHDPATCPVCMEIHGALEATAEEEKALADAP